MSNLKRTTIVLCGLFLFAITPSINAYDDGDWQNWQTYKVKGKMADTITASLEIEARFADNVSEYCYLHADGGVSFSVHKFFSLGFNMRFKNELKKASKVHPWKDVDTEGLPDEFQDQWDAIMGSNLWVKKYSPHINATVSFKPGGSKLKARTRLEIGITKDQVLNTANGGYDIVGETSTDYYLREKVSYDLPFKFSIVQPWVADELFFKLNAEEDENFFYRNRLSAGIKLKIYEKLTLSPYWLLQMTEKKKDDDWKKYYVIGLKTELGF